MHAIHAKKTKQYNTKETKNETKLNKETFSQESEPLWQQSRAEQSRGMLG
jgi:hypothetical protein